MNTCWKAMYSCGDLCMAVEGMYSCGLNCIALEGHV